MKQKFSWKQRLILLILVAVGFGVLVWIGVSRNMSGSWQGSSFVSKELDLKFTLPEGWTAATKEDIQTQVENTKKQMEATDPDTAAKVDWEKQIDQFLMVAGNKDTGVGANITTQNSSAEPKQLLDQYFGEDAAAKVYESDTYTAEHQDDRTLGGTTFQCIKVTAANTGNVTYVCAASVNGWLVTLSVAGPADTDFESVFSCFTTAE